MYPLPTIMVSNVQFYSYFEIHNYWQYILLLKLWEKNISWQSSTLGCMWLIQTSWMNFPDLSHSHSVPWWSVPAKAAGNVTVFVTLEWPTAGHIGTLKILCWIVTVQTVCLEYLKFRNLPVQWGYNPSTRAALSVRPWVRGQIRLPDHIWKKRKYNFCFLLQKPKGSQQ